MKIMSITGYIGMDVPTSGVAAAVQLPESTATQQLTQSWERSQSDESKRPPHKKARTKQESDSDSDSDEIVILADVTSDEPLQPDTGKQCIEKLPTFLRQRCRALTQTSIPRGDGSYVLYWMQYALRSAENPALCTAQSVANALSSSKGSPVPVIAVQLLCASGPYMNDRRAAFELQCAYDLQTSLDGVTPFVLISVPNM